MNRSAPGPARGTLPGRAVSDRVPEGIRRPDPNWDEVAMGWRAVLLAILWAGAGPAEEPPPADAAWDGVRDRLSRAAAG